MGSEQSQPSGGGGGSASHGATPLAQRHSSMHQNNMNPRPFTAGSRLHRGNTIAVTGQTGDHDSGSSGIAHPALAFHSDSRPVSPPMSVCSDSDLPYISYTDKPIGDSPKFRNKGPMSAAQKTARNSMYETSRKPSLVPKRPISTHTIVVVRAAAAKEVGIDKDPDIQKIQNIPQFLPVMRASVSLPANRDPEVLERLDPAHLNNICVRMQTHLNLCASKVSSEQNLINIRIKEVDTEATRAHALMTEKQKLYATYADHFSKVRHISQQLTRCNALLNQNIECMETLNNMLDVEHRLEPFVWRTSRQLNSH